MTTSQASTRDQAAVVTAMLEARIIALVGASARPDSLGARMAGHVARSPSRPRTYLVNPRYRHIDGEPCLPSLADVPEPADLAAELGVPFAAVAGLVATAQLVPAAVAAPFTAAVVAVGFQVAGRPRTPLRSLRMMRLAGKGGAVGLVEPMRRGGAGRLRARAAARSLGRAATLAALAGLLAACGSSGSASSAPPAPATTTPAGPVPASAAASSFTGIVEPFDPGHPARTEPAPATCGGQATTIAIQQCYQTKTENVDVQIDVVQSAKYASASAADRAAMNTQDSAWLAARTPVCAAAFNTGGTIDGISATACLLDESNARLDAVKGITPPEAVLKSTDSTDPNQLSWYTTPEGSRIAEIDTQGDQTGGAVITWVIIGGADSFVVNPRQFYFQDKSFTGPGVVEPPDPAYHKVTTGKEYEFGIDYSTLSKDPNGGKSGAGYVYAPGAPVAVWG